ncbi:PspC domain-containing protein [Desulfocurvibacter africanus]|uniref:PspC domain protein n=1 Tax=Desulfocurvibacter africanus subsp. africanus str. Walvis Bay TaxID=690850 RepID=F3YZ18_DESAF|nr:PspC domain-containing protein [Desulfocurvibacter africanus]EGJ49663.1 PspC domain protein [Desulfocurvibacter africanus subsp. africanus str. Walvis Bay]
MRLNMNRSMCGHRRQGHRGNHHQPFHSGGSRRPYRSRSGILLGVCKGLANYLGTSAFVVRMIFILGMLFTGLWPLVGLYFLTALLMKPEPALPPADMHEQELYDLYTRDPARATSSLRERFQRVDLRIRRIEDLVTSRSAREAEWDRRLRRG